MTPLMFSALSRIAAARSAPLGHGCIDVAMAEHELADLRHQGLIRHHAGVAIDLEHERADRDLGLIAPRGQEYGFVAAPLAVAIPSPRARGRRVLGRDAQLVAR